MALYAIGDVQGCHAEFCDLLTLIGFSPLRDRLWLTGDLVNRGPDSLAVLREVIALGDAAVTVLGNHDLHLLTVAAGHRNAHRDDTLATILEAPDRVDLFDWLAVDRSKVRCGIAHREQCHRNGVGRKLQPLRQFLHHSGVEGAHQRPKTQAARRHEHVLNGLVDRTSGQKPVSR